MSLSFFVFASTTLLVAADRFDDWSLQYGKRYSPEERSMRRTVFLANVQSIEQHNAQDDAVKLAVNQFADLNWGEFQAFYLNGLRLPVDPGGPRALRGDTGAFDSRALQAGGRNTGGTGGGAKTGGTTGGTGGAKVSATPSPTVTPTATPTKSAQPTPTPTALPASLDWATAGYVAPVRDQGQCGGCWAFSGQAAVESAVAIKAGTPGTVPDLSEQMCLDCVGSTYGCYGCSGGWMTGVYRYNIATGGSCRDVDYPYTGTQAGCKTTCTKTARLSGFTSVTANSRSALMTAVLQQPVAVAVEADGAAFQFYSSGVLTASCGSSVNHAVLLVGYGTDATGGDFWRVKNSWGTSWGESGFMRLARGSAWDPAGQCGIQTNPSYPIAA